VGSNPTPERGRGIGKRIRHSSLSTCSPSDLFRRRRRLDAVTSSVTRSLPWRDIRPDHSPPARQANSFLSAARRCGGGVGSGSFVNLQVAGANPVVRFGACSSAAEQQTLYRFRLFPLASDIVGGGDRSGYFAPDPYGGWDLASAGSICSVAATTDGSAGISVSPVPRRRCRFASFPKRFLLHHATTLLCSPRPAMTPGPKQR
jgi:hypothetical protein